MRGIEQQFLALQKGLTEVVPGTLLKPFDEREIELIISGIGTIDIEDWKRNTRLKVIINKFYFLELLLIIYLLKLFYIQALFI
jgi:hypothetical protein